MAEAVERATYALLGVRQDAALLLHDQHADPDEVTRFLARWLLVTEDRARQIVRFLASPLCRAYTTTYVEGHRLLRAWLAARPVGERFARRYCRLLDEPLVPAVIQDELAAGLARMAHHPQPDVVTEGDPEGTHSVADYGNEDPPFSPPGFTL